MTEIMLTVEDATAFYGDFQALFGSNLQISKGEAVAIVGSNGAGKSTLLKTITGQVRLASGSIKFKGSDIGSVPAHKRVDLGIALVPEGRRLFPSLTVKENLMIGAHSGRKGKWTVELVVDTFPLLKPLLKKPSGKLSGGEQQTVAVGRALMANPDLLLLDEVSLGLAPIVVGQLYEALAEIRHTGTTMLIVEQDISRALDAADRLYCLLEGRTVLTGRPSELERADITAAYFGAL